MGREATAHRVRPDDAHLAVVVSYPISYTVRNWTGRPKNPETVREGWDWFFSAPQGTIDGLSRDDVAFVYPRFDEVPAKAMGATYITRPPRSIDPWLTQCAYERQWRQLAEQRAAVQVVVLYGWNLYGEQAFVEPATAAAPRPSIDYSYVDRTRAYWQALTSVHALGLASPCIFVLWLTGDAAR